MPGSYVSHLECTACGDRSEADALHRTCPSCGKVLFARYDLAALRAEMPAPAFDGRSWDLWRYRELLPVRDDRFALSLGEGGTPLVS
ncbi:MAG TPA: threonine synthase, partial [Candidatus Limnocylindria bacterium]|nr:threonine synthase [Candidatus Limnocylindria bacterium]